MKRTLVTFVLVGLVVAACGGSSGDSTTTTEAAEATTTSEAAQQTTSSTESSTTSAPEATGGGDDCLEGEWLLDNEAFIDEVFSNLGGSSFGEASAAGGTLTVTLNQDGTMSTSRDQWGFVMAGDQGTFKILISGDQTGTWGTEGDQLSISLDEGPPPEITTSMEVDGQELPIPDAPMEVPSDALSATSTFSCGSDSFSVSTDDFTSTFNRP